MQWRGRSRAEPIGRLPITFIHQDLGLVDSMTVAENVALRPATRAARADRLARRRRGRPGLRSASWAAASIPTRGLGRSRRPTSRSSRSHGRWPANATSWCSTSRPRRLPAADVELLLDTLVRLKASGIGLLYVTHRLDEVFRIADRVTVLRDGRRIATRAVCETHARRPRRLDRRRGARGDDTSRRRPPTRRCSRCDAVRCRRTTEPGASGRSRSRSAAARPWAGRPARGRAPRVGRALFGAVPVRPAHRPSRDGDRLREPAAAMRAGIGFVSSRRGEESLAGDCSVLENLYVNSRGIAAFAPASVGRRA